MKAAGVAYTDVIKYTDQTEKSRDALREMGLSDTSVLSLTGWSCAQGKFTKRFKLAKRWLPLLDCKIPVQSKCCPILKEAPLDALTYENVMTGEQAQESINRETEWLKNGCNYTMAGGGYKSKPFGSLSYQAVLWAIKYRNVPLSPDYGEIVQCGDCLKCTKANRTGCALCGFGIQFDPGRFQRLVETDAAKLRWAFSPRENGGGGYRELCEYANEYCGTKIIIPDI